MKTSISNLAVGNIEDPAYDDFLERVHRRFASMPTNGLFTTKTDGLWEAYLNSFPSPIRQFYNCNCCRRFIENFGGLVCIDENGKAESVLWGDEPSEEYRDAVANMRKIVNSSDVSGVFLSSEKVYGFPVTGQWRHISVSATSIFSHAIDTAGQAMASRREDFRMLSEAINAVKEETLKTAVTLLKADALYRSEKVLGMAEWLLATKLERSRNQRFNRNLMWRRVANAPAGFCHMRSSMIGTLIEDIESGLPNDEVARKFAAKMHPLAYQRPQAAPKAGNIAEAERIVATLNAEGSLERRFARFNEVKTVWVPTQVKSKGGVFGDLLAKQHEPDKATVKGAAMSWLKFQRDVLPTAESIKIHVGRGNLPFTSLLTATNADSPPILQWDSLDCRNPVSWYFWSGGVTAEQYRTAHGWNKVTGITLQPSMWNGGFEHQGKGVMFIIEGAKETRNPSLCLFPEILKSEYRGIRSTLEMYSNSKKVSGESEQSACGLMYKSGDSRAWDIRLDVQSGKVAIGYTIDRWE